MYMKKARFNGKILDFMEMNEYEKTEYHLQLIHDILLDRERSKGELYYEIDILECEWA